MIGFLAGKRSKLRTALSRWSDSGTTTSSASVSSAAQARGSKFEAITQYLSFIMKLSRSQKKV
jgi:hypothetical protein